MKRSLGVPLAILAAMALLIAPSMAAPSGDSGRPAEKQNSEKAVPSSQPSHSASAKSQGNNTAPSPQPSVLNQPNNNGQSGNSGNSGQSNGNQRPSSNGPSEQSRGQSGTEAAAPVRNQQAEAALNLGQSNPQSKANQSPAERALNNLQGKKRTEAARANQSALLECVSEELTQLAQNQAKEKKAKADIASLNTTQVTATEQTCVEEVGDKGSYIVVFKNGVNPQAASVNAQGKSAIQAKNRFKIEEVYGQAINGMAVIAGQLQVAQLRNNPDVASVEADGVVSTNTVQTGATWGLDRIDQRSLPLDNSFSDVSGTGTGVRAYVIDTGIYASHSELSGRVAPGYTAIADGQGTNDCNGHGTHVSGTIAGTTYGVAKAATLVPVRVLDCSGAGTYSGVIAGINWAIADHAAGTPAVANLSLGGSYSSTVNTAIANLVSDGVTVAVAAGNSADNACNYSPSSSPSAITVGAVDSSDRQASFSNFGTCVDLYAPGVSITSSWNSGSTATAVLSGTSMASPHVAGAAAQILSGSPTLSPSQVWDSLRAKVTVNTLASLGSGSPNALLFVGSADTQTPTPPPAPTLTVPAAPSGVVAIAGVRSANVSWVLSANSGGSAITSQTVFVYDRSARKVGAINVSTTQTSVSVTQLKSKAVYSFTVAATNAVGQSAESSSSSAVTIRSATNNARSTR